MVKILVLLFGVAMFFGGFWRAAENKKQAVNSLPPEEKPLMPENISAEPEDSTKPEADGADEIIEKIAPKTAQTRKSASNGRSKSKRANKKVA